MLTVKREYEAYLDDMNIVTILWPEERIGNQDKQFYLCTSNENIHLQLKESYRIDRFHKYVVKLPNPLSFGETHYIVDESGCKTDLQMGAVIRTREFDEMFYYEGVDLGIQYNQSHISGKVWAPTATAMILKLTHPETKEVKQIQMRREKRGIWSFTIEGNYEGFYYSYLVCVNLVWNEVVDPYAKAVSQNGEYGVIIDLEQTMVEKIEVPPIEKSTDAVIYELHIRDFSIHPHSGIEQKGKYKAFTEWNTSTPKGFSTGMRYLTELGITHVEVLPFNDFAGVDETEPDQLYNWGYNPIHFNAPEGSYATDSIHAKVRIRELKEMIQAFHRHSLKVIMDVVYNHVFIREESHFEKLVPGYFFRHDQYGVPSNGTGVGNDIASERKMVRKYIIDSVIYWMEEYDVDGFRFDLMGILDIETMNKVHEEVRKWKHDAIILGEGWDLQTPLPYNQKATIANAIKMPGLSFFNDHFRDTVKGSTFLIHDKGFALGNPHKISGMLESVTGSIPYNPHLRGLFQHPVQSVNYVESHDNHTFWDKMSLSLDDETEEMRRDRQRLALGIVILSQGIPFIHSGQEFYRSKYGEENSYKSPDHINQLDWNRRERFEEDIQYVKQLISIRKYHGIFRLACAEKVKEHCSFFHSHDGIIAYRYDHVSSYGPWDKVIVIHKNNDKEFMLFLENNQGWKVACTPTSCSVEEPVQHVFEKIALKRIGTYVLYQN
ncbi:type I pullulanase [Bacillus kexueae]|uniref:type I pullulanase n=1 Tax=Aeribacillus kexueae TaxID=2078952 RepID=UPI001FAE899D|nr:type I pullulanase [Bacillus kexueae]